MITLNGFPTQKLLQPRTSGWSPNQPGSSSHHEALPTLGVEAHEFFSHVKRWPTFRPVAKDGISPNASVDTVIEWEHEVRVLFRSNRTRSSPASPED
jgi:hypothetical protein